MSSNSKNNTNNNHHDHSNFLFPGPQTLTPQTQSLSASAQSSLLALSLSPLSMLDIQPQPVFRSLIDSYPLPNHNNNNNNNNTNTLHLDDDDNTFRSLTALSSSFTSTALHRQPQAHRHADSLFYASRQGLSGSSKLSLPDSPWSTPSVNHHDKLDLTYTVVNDNQNDKDNNDKQRVPIPDAPIYLEPHSTFHVDDNSNNSASSSSSFTVIDLLMQVGVTLSLMMERTVDAPHTIKCTHINSMTHFKCKLYQQQQQSASRLLLEFQRRRGCPSIFYSLYSQLVHALNTLNNNNHAFKITLTPFQTASSSSTSSTSSMSFSPSLPMPSLSHSSSLSSSSSSSSLSLSLSLSDDDCRLLCLMIKGGSVDALSSLVEACLSSSSCLSSCSSSSLSDVMDAVSLSLLSDSVDMKLLSCTLLRALSLSLSAKTIINASTITETCVKHLMNIVRCSSASSLPLVSAASSALVHMLTSSSSLSAVFTADDRNIIQQAQASLSSSSSSSSSSSFSLFSAPGEMLVDRSDIERAWSCSQVQVC